MDLHVLIMINKVSLMSSCDNTVVLANSFAKSHTSSLLYHNFITMMWFQCRKLATHLLTLSLIFGSYECIIKEQFCMNAIVKKCLHCLEWAVLVVAGCSVDWLIKLSIIAKFYRITWPRVVSGNSFDNLENSTGVRGENLLN